MRGGIKTGKGGVTISAVIPMYQESRHARACVQRALDQGFSEVIAVDGGSTDGTLDILAEFSEAVIRRSSPVADRGTQMNIGAAAASGDVLLFLHADLILPETAGDLIGRAISAGYRAGGFYKSYATRHYGLRIYQALLNRLYLRDGRGLVGSNAMFVERALFETLGGFSQEGFLEDVILADRLAAAGPLAVIRQPVTVSPRWYLERGVLRQIGINARVMFGYRVLKQPPSRLKTLYAAASMSHSDASRPRDGVTTLP